MISVATGDLMQAEAEALVNPVNCVGVMGKGLALQFRERFPEMFASYVRVCAAGEFAFGRMHVFDRGADYATARWIMSFPTTRHWREPSWMVDVEAGLAALVADVAELRIRSVAVLAMGCGFGGLKWEAVRPRIEAAFAPLFYACVLAPGLSALLDRGDFPGIRARDPGLYQCVKAVGPQGLKQIQDYVASNGTTKDLSDAA
jgi:O-acetyl-ADP-ribose deacetylase (regulator of RNase III)